MFRFQSNKWLAAARVAIACASLGSCSPAANDDKHDVVIFTYVTYPILDESIAGIKEGLAEKGFTPDRVNLRVINANGQSDLVGSYAREILNTHPDLVIPVSTPVAQAVVSAAPQTQRIVFGTVTNPSDVGMDRHPPNLTGVSDVVNYEANIDLIRELAPSAKRIAMIYNPSEANSRYAVDQLKPIMTKRGLTLILVPVSKSDEVVAAVRTLSSRADVLYIGSDNTVASAIDGVIAAARHLRLPVIASDAGSVEKGAIAAVSVDYRKLGRSTGILAADVLRSSKPVSAFPNILFKGDLLVINPAAAEAIGFPIPHTVRARAQRVIQRVKAAA